jgi:hypothetical protein
MSVQKMAREMTREPVVYAPTFPPGVTYIVSRAPSNLKIGGWVKPDVLA